MELITHRAIVPFLFGDRPHIRCALEAKSAGYHAEGQEDLSLPIVFWR